MLINTSITKKNNTVEHSGMLSLLNSLIRSPKFRQRSRQILFPIRKPDDFYENFYKYKTPLKAEYTKHDIYSALCSIYQIMLIEVALKAKFWAGSVNSQERNPRGSGNSLQRHPAYVYRENDNRKRRLLNLGSDGGHRLWRDIEPLHNKHSLCHRHFYK